MEIRPSFIVLPGNRDSRQLEKFNKTKSKRSLADLRQLTKGGSLSL